jgi:Co/Zn/Cd efflux system component
MASAKMVFRISSRRVIYAAIIGDLLVGATKFAAAAWTGSSAMLSEGVHSIVDTGNGFLLLHGLQRAAAGPDRSKGVNFGVQPRFKSSAAPCRARDPG